MSDTSRIRITRQRGVRDKFRRYKVRIDGDVVARLKAGESFATDIAPGRHYLDVRIDWTGSGDLFFDCVAGETLSFECGPGGSPFTGVVDMLQIDGYIALARVD